jgi:hypothetical protein
MRQRDAADRTDSKVRGDRREHGRDVHDDANDDSFPSS